MSSKPNPRRVGILGGMGPAATVDLMAKVLSATPATRDEEHVPLVVWSIPQVPSRPAAMQAAVDRAIAHVKAGELDRARTELVPVALAMLDRGADAVLLACTELPLVPCPEELRGKLVDPTMALARAIVAHSRGAPCEPSGADVS